MNVSPQKKKYKPDIKEYTRGKYSSVVDGDSLYFPWKLSPGADTNQQQQQHNNKTFIITLLNYNKYLQW
jgi:hypothetical protein